jgi:hypothetical protein
VDAWLGIGESERVEFFLKALECSSRKREEWEVILELWESCNTSFSYTKSRHTIGYTLLCGGEECMEVFSEIFECLSFSRIGDIWDVDVDRIHGLFISIGFLIECYPLGCWHFGHELSDEWVGDFFCILEPDTRLAHIEFSYIFPTIGILPPLEQSGMSVDAHVIEVYPVLLIRERDEGEW